MLTKEFLDYGISKLKENNIDSSLAKYLYKYIDDKEKYVEGINQIISGIPVQYIVGNVNFYGYIFNVNSNVLIPRFETEELVNKTVDYMESYFDKKIDIVDIGTGSGCIAIALKKTLPESRVSAVDISSKALEVAMDNAKLNNSDINFHLGDLLEPLEEKFDCIISNPPYIDPKDPDVMDIVRNNEPVLALYANKEGLENYERILSQAGNHLKEKSMIAFEIGANQGSRVKSLALTYFPNARILVEKDMQNRDRFVFIFNNL